jgi:hypothetical protein
MAEDPRVLAAKLKAHSHVISKVREIHAIKMRAAKARIHAVEQARLAHETKLQIAKHVTEAKVAYAAAAHKHIAAMKAARG